MVVPCKQLRSDLMSQVSTLRKDNNSIECNIRGHQSETAIFVVKEFSVGNSNLPKQSKCSSGKGSSEEVAG